MLSVKIIHRIFVMALFMSFIFINAGFGADSAALGGTDLPQLEIPKPQFFCGYCHVLTYPSIVMKGYELWKKGKHKEVGCVECHYPPRAGKAGSEGSAGGARAVHIPKRAPESFSYLQLGGGTVKTRPKIINESCMSSRCHGRAEDDFKTKKIKFTEKVTFVHQPHFEEKNQVAGLKLNCTNCHQHETEKKKFEVAQATCYLCHFQNAKFNEGRAKCELCHVLPKKPIQTSGDKPITHEMLKTAKVPCGSCHFELIQASGGGKYEAYFEDGVLKTAMVLGAGQTKKENCRACHDGEKELKEGGNPKLMHEKHVTIKNARCFDCHRPIRHVKADLKKPMHSQPMIDGCGSCHPEPHRLQLLLAAGPKREGVLSSPDPMHRVRTNCLGCHIEMGISKRGEKVVTASGKACVRCHTKGHDKMLRDWKTELAKEIKATEEIREEALEALEESKTKLSRSKLAEARQMLEEGLENLQIVRFGNGVHNKKYSMMLLDAAMTSFEDMIDFLEEGGE